MSRPTIHNPQYRNLDSTTALRESERDAMLYDQNKLLEERNRLLKEQRDIQRYGSAATSSRDIPDTLGTLLLSILSIAVILIGVALVGCHLTSYSTFSIIFLVITSLVVLCGALDMIEEYRNNKKRK